MEYDVTTKILLLLKENWKNWLFSWNISVLFHTGIHAHRCTKEVLQWTFHERLTEKYERGWAEEREKMFVASVFFLKSEGKGSAILPGLMQEFRWSFLIVVKIQSYWGNTLQKRNSKYFACMEAAVVMERQLLSLYPRHHDIQLLWSLHSCFANDCILFCLKLNSKTYFQANIC